MKKLSTILTVSIVANIALLVIVASRPQVNSQVSESSSPKGYPVTTIPTASSTLSEADTASLIRSQELLATDDLPTLVARLRAARFSPMDIRGIVSARLSEQYGARRKAAIADLEVVPYWQGSSSFPRNPEAGAEVTRLFREQKDRLKQLLGPDANPNDEWSQMLRQREFGYLPSDKVDRMQNILADYKELRSKVFLNTYGARMPEDQEKLQLIEMEQRADLETLFTPDELVAYDMRTSTIAKLLRNNLRSFKPTEAEYRALYLLTEAANPDRQNPRVLPIGPANNPALIQLQEEIETALGPKRAAEYLLKTKSEYMQVDRLTTRLGLPATITPKVYSTGEDFRQRVRTIQSNQTLTVETRASQLKALALEAEQQFTHLLGQRGL